ncbi:MAG: chemotaxis protein CheD [Lachnospiraceae bacterium]|nr:chemotaxis protein CheD [Lachnospiraceae bacterium]MBR5179129.1 chemotaxis protein CheD [Lachnospiraceae bacterium]
MGNLVRVGMADMNICRAPDRIITLGLGSCIGLVLFDIKSSVCGMLHVMLPDSSISKRTENPAKFADTGVEKLIEELRKQGVPQRALMAKMAGGARMFAFQGSGDYLNIGERNAEAVKGILMKKGIPIVASDCGGTYGRTIEFDPETYRLQIRAIGKPEKYI